MMSTFNTYLAAIEKIQPLKGRLLDVGTATGIFLQRAQTAGWNATGLELSEYAAHQARAKGLNVRTGSLAESTFNAAQFDAVTLWDVFEHLPQPDDSLKYINKILKPGGVLAMSTPDCRSLYARLAGKRWHLIKPPEHVFLYNLKSLKMILNRHGFAIKTISKISKAYSLAYIFTILYGWQKKLFWLKCAEAVKKSRLNNIVIPIHLRDNIFIIAKKI